MLSLLRDVESVAREEDDVESVDHFDSHSPVSGSRSDVKFLAQTSWTPPHQGNNDGDETFLESRSQYSPIVPFLGHSHVDIKVVQLALAAEFGVLPVSSEALVKSSRTDFLVVASSRTDIVSLSSSSSSALDVVKKQKTSSSSSSLSLSLSLSCRR